MKRRVILSGLAVLCMAFANAADTTRGPEAGQAGSAPFRLINIAPLLVNHKTEITEDLLRLHRDCGVTDIAFMLPLSPEEAEPTMAKAQHLRDLFFGDADTVARIGVAGGDSHPEPDWARNADCGQVSAYRRARWHPQ